jgi:hypothetical protein
MPSLIAARLRSVIPPDTSLSISRQIPLTVITKLSDSLTDDRQLPAGHNLSRNLTASSAGTLIQAETTNEKLRYLRLTSHTNPGQTTLKESYSVVISSQFEVRFPAIRHCSI